MRRDYLTMLTLSTALLGLTTAELAFTCAHRLRRGLLRLPLNPGERRLRALTS